MYGLEWWQWATVACAGFGMSALATRALIPWLQTRQILDIPSERSSHETPTPRGGGLGIAAGFLVALLAAALFGAQLPSAAMLVGAGVIATLGFLDDRHGLGVGARLGIQVSVALTIAGLSGGLTGWPAPQPLAGDTGHLAAPLAVIWIVSVVNFYNFLDGIDGYAATQSVIAGAALALAYPGSSVASVGWALAGASGGFLLWNWHRARVFMGDVGSCLIGFLLAAAPFELPPAERGDGVLLVALALWFFLSDGTYTLFSRLLAGEKVWKPHRRHLYQRLTQTGLRHDTVVICIGVGAALVAALALSAHRTGRTSQWISLGVAAAAFVALNLWVQHRERVAATRQSRVSDQLPVPR